MAEYYKVKKVPGPVDWKVQVPGSKSITNRALLMAALANQRVCLHGVLFSDDSRYFLKSLQSLGYLVEINEKERSVIVVGSQGKIPAKCGEIYVGSAGTAARFLTAMLGVSDGVYTIQASEQMKKRPMRPLFEALQSLGAKICFLEEQWHLPVEITGAAIAQRDGICELSLDISESTQFLSAFLLISPMFANGLRIHITSEKKDGSYIRITRRMMQQFGVCASFDGNSYEVAAGSSYDCPEYQIEPDMSAACYFYGAAAVTGGQALVEHITGDCMQGDLKFLQVLERMGCIVSETAEGIRVRGPEGGKLKGITVDMNDFSDQALTLAAIAPYADGPVEICHIAHIRRQESDRIHAMVSNLQKAGISCDEKEDGVVIYPRIPKACEIETFEDHRVAMAFSLLGLPVGNITILDPDCCRKTFEEYFAVLDRLMKS